jgi:hypothetical protein
MSTPPARTAPNPITANSSTSAPVKGRLVVEGSVGAATVGEIVLVSGSWLTGNTAGGFPGGIGGAGVQPWASDIDPQGFVALAAPAVAGTAIIDATANPDPINKRRAHMMVALLVVGGGTPACPFTDHVIRW